MGSQNCFHLKWKWKAKTPNLDLSFAAIIIAFIHHATHITVQHRCSSKVLDEPYCLQMVVPASHGIRRSIKKHIQPFHEITIKRIVLSQVTLCTQDRANEQAFLPSFLFPVPCHYLRRTFYLKTCWGYCYTSINAARWVNKRTHLVIQSSGQSWKWEKGFQTGREAPSQENKSQQERGGSTALPLCASGVRGLKRGPARGCKRKKGVDTPSAKESMEFSFPENEGERIEIKGNAQLILNLWTLFSLWTDNTLCSSTKFSDLLCLSRTLASGYCRNIKNKFKKKVMEGGTKSLKMERNGEG